MPARPGRSRWSSRSMTLLGFELGTRSTGNTEYPPFVRGAAATTPLALLNQDIVAYAPDNPTLPTVANYPTPGVPGFEATPVTTGSYNPLTGGLRGFSVVIYGLQHDLNSHAGSPAWSQRRPSIAHARQSTAVQSERRLAAVHSRQYSGAFLCQFGGVSVGRPKSSRVERQHHPWIRFDAACAKHFALAAGQYRRQADQSTPCDGTEQRQHGFSGRAIAAR